MENDFKIDLCYINIVEEYKYHNLFKLLSHEST